MSEILEFGVCRLSIIPVRKEASHVSEQVSQLLFGEEYEVLEYSKEKTWLKIRIRFDQYEGWIDQSQHHPITQEYFEYISRAEFKITTDLTSSLLYNKNHVPIVMGSIIPISNSELFKMEEQFAFNGESKAVGLKREFEFLKLVAFKYLNSPYQWGGRSPFGIDCSGFVQMVFKICGYRLLRDAHQQAAQGKPVEGVEDVKPGDLAFFTNDKGRIVHTGIVLPDRRIIHASGRVRIDGIDGHGIMNEETKSYTHRLSLIRRLLA